MIEKTSAMQPGTYWIGDPCYVLNKRNGFDWSTLLARTNCLRGGTKERPENGGLFFYLDDETNRHVTFFVSSTAHGDGIYLDNYDNEYGVDAGCIACIPLDAIQSKDGNLRQQFNDLVTLSGGHVHTMNERFYASTIDEVGDICFGRVRISTSYDEQDIDGW